MMDHQSDNNLTVPIKQVISTTWKYQFSVLFSIFFFNGRFLLPRLTLPISQYIIPNITENAANTQTEKNHRVIRSIGAILLYRYLQG